MAAAWPMRRRAPPAGRWRRYCRDLVRLEGALRGGPGRARARADAAEAAAPPRFPLRGRDVTALGIAAGARVGALLKAVEAWWEAGDFEADRAACLDELRRRA